MLRKLLKYDFRNSGRLLLPIYAGLLLISLFGKLILETNLYQTVPSSIQILSVMTYVLIIIVCFVGTPIYFVVYFYRSFYTDKGYIVHSLPITTHQKLISKVISSFIMELITFAICLLSISMILYDREVFSYIRRAFLSIDVNFRAMTDVSFQTFLMLTFVAMLTSILTQLLMLFAAISIGQFFNTHRILGAIGAYLILYFFNQFISMILLLIISVNMVSTGAFVTGTSLLALYGLTICSNLLLSLAYYMISYYFMEKRLNLN